jgi:hypothetical protein
VLSRNSKPKNGKSVGRKVGKVIKVKKILAGSGFFTKETCGETVGFCSFAPASPIG